MLTIHIILILVLTLALCFYRNGKHPTKLDQKLKYIDFSQKMIVVGM